jgi:hypothetical protein
MMLFICKQLAAILPLQIMNVLGNGRLRDVKHFRGLSVIHALTKGEEGFDSVVYHTFLQ